MPSFEKALAETLEPVIDEVAKIARALETVELKAGPAGKDCRPEDVAALLIEKHADLLRGPAGKDAEPVTVCLDDVADTLKASPDFMEMIKGDPGTNGEPGTAPDAETIAKAIFDNYRELLQGEKGEPATIDPEAVGAILKADNGFISRTKGEPGERGTDGTGIICKQWEPAIFRENSIVQHNLGQFFRAKADTNEEPGRGDSWERLGTAGFRWCGVKSETENYTDGDLYIDDGTTFLFWQGKGRMVSRRGRNGDKGEQGAPGAPAPALVAASMTIKGIALVLDNGEVLESPIDGLTEYIEQSTARQTEELYNQKAQDEESQDGLILKRWHGDLKRNKHYSRGDVVNYRGAVHVFNEDAAGRNPEASMTKIFEPATPKTKAILPATNDRVCHIEGTKKTANYETEDTDLKLPVGGFKKNTLYKILAPVSMVGFSCESDNILTITYCIDNLDFRVVGLQCINSVVRSSRIKMITKDKIKIELILDPDRYDNLKNFDISLDLICKSDCNETTLTVMVNPQKRFTRKPEIVFLSDFSVIQLASWI